MARRVTTCLMMTAAVVGTVTTGGSVTAVESPADAAMQADTSARKLKCDLDSSRPKVVYVSGIPRYVKVTARVDCNRKKRVKVWPEIWIDGEFVDYNVKERKHRRHVRAKVTHSRRGCHTYKAKSTGFAGRIEKVPEVWRWQDQIVKRKRLCL